MPKSCCNTNWFPDRADIQQDSSTDGEANEDFTGDPFKKGVPGKLIDVGGEESFHGRKIESRITSVFECRYFAGVKPTMRVNLTAGLHKDRLLNIEYVKVVREQGAVPKQWLYCTELVEE